MGKEVTKFQTKACDPTTMFYNAYLLPRAMSKYLLHLNIGAVAKGSHGFHIPGGLVTNN